MYIPVGLCSQISVGKNAQEELEHQAMFLDMLRLAGYRFAPSKCFLAMPIWLHNLRLLRPTSIRIPFGFEDHDVVWQPMLVIRKENKLACWKGKTSVLRCDEKICTQSIVTDSATPATTTK